MYVCRHCSQQCYFFCTYRKVDGSSLWKGHAVHLLNVKLKIKSKCISPWALIVADVVTLKKNALLEQEKTYVYNENCYLKLDLFSPYFVFSRAFPPIHRKGFCTILASSAAKGPFSLILL